MWKFLSQNVGDVNVTESLFQSHTVRPIPSQMASQPGVFVAGVAMTPFHRAAKPRPNYVELGRQAILEALADAQVSGREVDAVVASYNYGEAACGHRVAHAAGLENIPIFNVNGNCSAGSVALALARKLVSS